MKWSILAVWSAVTFGLGLTAFGQSNPLENTQPPKLTIDRAALSGPFGFRSGMSREQIVQAVGKENVAAIDSDALGGVTMFVSTAPKPHAAFTDYVLDVSPERGLLRIEAFSRSIDTSEDGSELSSTFWAIKQQLLNTYGDPSENLDSVKTGSLWREPRDFMMGLLKHDRRLSSSWRSDDRYPIKDSIVDITLKAGAKDTSTGFVTISYSFIGWTQYYRTLKLKEGAVL